MSAAFELDDNAIGGTIGNNINPRLGGTRIGPYRLRGRCKGSSGPMDLSITLNTTLTFLDAQGHETTRIATATHVREIFTSFEIENATSTMAKTH